jgi:hypothetical protein
VLEQQFEWLDDDDDRIDGYDGRRRDDGSGRIDDQRGRHLDPVRGDRL